MIAIQWLPVVPLAPATTARSNTEARESDVIACEKGYGTVDCFRATSGPGETRLGPPGACKAPPGPPGISWRFPLQRKYKRNAASAKKIKSAAKLSIEHMMVFQRQPYHGARTKKFSAHASHTLLAGSRIRLSAFRDLGRAGSRRELAPVRHHRGSAINPRSINQSIDQSIYRLLDPWSATPCADRVFTSACSSPCRFGVGVVRCIAPN